jgi:hypothetical protein
MFVASQGGKHRNESICIMYTHIPVQKPPVTVISISRGEMTSYLVSYLTHQRYMVGLLKNC